MLGNWTALGSRTACLQLVCWVVSLILLPRSIAAANNGSVGAQAAYSKLSEQASCPQAAQDGRETCPLWGCQGELWDRGGLISDWSFAGYGAGLESIPSPPVTVDVKRDFQAAGNGVTDDSAAVRAALAATQKTGGVIYFPPGKYVLSDQLVLSSYQVLRGAGRDSTRLHFTRSMVDLQGGWGSNYSAGHGASKFTWQGALITNQKEQGVFPPHVNLHLGLVGKPAKRGDTRLYLGELVRNTSSAKLLFVPGQWYALAMAENAEGDLSRNLYNNKTSGGQSVHAFAGQYMMTLMTRITAVGDDWIDIERPLHVDVAPDKLRTVIARSANFRGTGIGVEDLEVSFPWTAYTGHHEEPGYNAIEFAGVINSWVRRVRVVNADTGIRLYGSIFNTISEIEVTNSPWPRKGGRWAGRDRVWQLVDMDGHMAIALHWASHDNLVEKFNIKGIYHHDLLVAAYSSHNVFTQGKGIDVCMDHHGAAPNNNLWTDIDVGLGQGAMRWSGDATSNPFAGKLNTFWGITASTLPTKMNYVSQLQAAGNGSLSNARESSRLYMGTRSADTLGYQQVVVDMPVDTQMPTVREAADWLVHYNPNRHVWPPNLYRAMVATAGRRLNLTTNGTLLSQLFPRLSKASTWPVKRTNATAAGAGQDVHCLNLGCQGSFTRNTSWLRNDSDFEYSKLPGYGHRKNSSRVSSSEDGEGGVDPFAAMSALISLNKLNKSLSSLKGPGLPDMAASTAASGDKGADNANPNDRSRIRSSMSPGASISLGPGLIDTLKRIVSMASNMLATLTQGVQTPTTSSPQPVVGLNSSSTTQQQQGKNFTQPPIPQLQQLQHKLQQPLQQRQKEPVKEATAASSLSIGRKMI